VSRNCRPVSTYLYDTSDVAIYPEDLMHPTFVYPISVWLKNRASNPLFPRQSEAPERSSALCIKV